MRANLESKARLSPQPRARSFTGGPGIVVPPSQIPSLPLSIMSIGTHSPTPTQSPTPPSPPPSTPPSPSPSPSTLASLNWAFQPINDATTCTNTNINFDFFNSQSDLSAIFSSTGNVNLDITISGFGSDANFAASLSFNGTAQNLLGSGNGVSWLVNVPPGTYDIFGIVSSPSADPHDSAPAIETAFAVHQGSTVSCTTTTSSSSGINNQAASQSTSHSSNAGAIAGGVIGGLLALALLAGLILIFLLRRRHHHGSRGNSSTSRRLSHSQHPQSLTKGWNGLTSVGSVNSVSVPVPLPVPAYTHSGVLEKQIFTPPHPSNNSNNNMLVQEPGSPPGSPASVELANLPFRRPTVGSIVTATTRRSMSGGTIHSGIAGLGGATAVPDPFATPLPGTPRAVSEIGHHGSGSGHGSGSSTSDFEVDSDTSSTKQSHVTSASRSPALVAAAAAAGAGALGATSLIAKRASHHSHYSRKPVPAYDELNLTSEEKEALEGGSSNGRSDDNENANTNENENEYNLNSPNILLSPHSTITPTQTQPSMYSPSSTVHMHNRAQQPSPSLYSNITTPTGTHAAQYGGNGTSPNSASEVDHEQHALALLKGLRSKSSGHMKGDAYVHYLIPDPPMPPSED